MKKPLVLLIAFFAAAILSADPVVDPGSNGVRFFLEPSIGKGLGGTAYDLSFPWSPNVTGSSRLQFPQAQFELGGILGLTIDKGGKRDWLFEAGFHHSVLSVAASMDDYDWIQVSGYPRIPFSYTYSADTTTDWSLSSEVAWTFLHAGAFDLSLYGMYRFQSTFHVEDGYTGWQWDPTVSPTVVVVTASAVPDVLEYTLSAHIPGLGLLAGVQFLRAARIDLRAAYTPVYVSDMDDHKLRTKLSTASGWGNGLYADLRATWQFKRTGRITPYIYIFGSLTYYVVSTTQTQYWYGTADPNAAQGTRITGIDYVISSEQYTLGIRMGFEL